MNSKLNTGKQREHVSEFQLQWEAERARVEKGKGREGGSEIITDVDSFALNIICICLMFVFFHHVCVLSLNPVVSHAHISNLRLQ